MAGSNRSSDFQDVPRPVAMLADEYPPDHVDAPHSHKRAQLIYATRGVMNVATARFSFVIPPQRAVWVPAGIEHEIRCRGPVSLRTLYIDPDIAFLPGDVRVIEVSNLLRELMALMLDEIVRTPVVPLSVPMPQHARLVAVCEHILRDPGRDEALDFWASEAGMGRRTFTRMFRKETGMSFALWCRDVRLLEAMSRLANGQPVTKVAFDVGYQSSSAFAAMFRRTFGAPPSRYVESLAAAR